MSSKETDKLHIDDNNKAEIIKVEKKTNFIFDKIKNFLNKDNYVLLKLILVAVLSCLIAIVLEYTIYRQIYVEYISKLRMIIITCFSFFVGLHFVIKLNKMYDFIHKYRYFIALAFLVFVMIFKLSGSSIVNYDGIIQSHNDDRKFHTVLGTGRLIRTDEWATSTTYILSQDNSQTPFSYFSNVLRGTETDMVTVANSEVLDILMLGRPFQIGFILFGNSMGLSFYWYIRLVAMMMGSYELFLILTKGNKKVSLVGMIVMTFSAATQWWYCLDVVIWGQIAMVLLDKFMKAKKKRIKYLCALGLIVSGLSYIFIMYPAWQLPFGYVYLAVVIYLLIDNIKYGDYKINLHDCIVMALAIIILGALVLRWYSNSKDAIDALANTDYPGTREEIGGGSLINYAYFYNMYFVREDFQNPCEFSAMISLFPVPLYLIAIYMVRNKKNLHFYIPMFLVTCFLGIFTVYGLPLWLSKLTKMSISTAGRTTIPLGVACIYLYITLMGQIKKEEKIASKWIAAILAIGFSIFIAYNANKNLKLGFTYEYDYLNLKKNLFSGVLFAIIIYGLFTLNNEKINKYTGYMLIFVALISGLGVNPIISSTDIFYKKPVAIKMNEIKEEEPDAIWFVNDDGWYINDYPLASGIRVINSTALYPNKDMWITLFGEEKALSDETRTIYNRYCHITGQVVNEETNIELLNVDNIKLNINYDDLLKLNVKYILSTEDLIEEGLSTEEYEQIYNEDGMYIYKILEGIN